MSRITTVFALALALFTSVVSAQSSTTFPTSGRSVLNYTSQTIDPVTGLVHITADAVNTGGLIGRATGSDSYTINPLTGTYVGSGQRTTADGSTYVIEYVGQFINGSDSVGTYTITSGTGRLAGITGQGTFAATRWASQLGASSTYAGTVTLPH